MAKQSDKRPEAKPEVPAPSTFSFRPTEDDSFRLVRAKGLPLWAIQVTRVTDGRHIFTVTLDPPDTLDSIERKVAGLVQEAARR